MSQTESLTCPTCKAPISPGQRFCSNCGSVVPDQSSTIAPTAASASSPTPNVQPPSPGLYSTPAPPGYQPPAQTVRAPSNPNYPPVPNYQPTERASGPYNPSSLSGSTTAQGPNYQSGEPAPASFYDIPPAVGTPGGPNYYGTSSAGVYNQNDTPPPPPTDPYGGNIDPNYTPPTPKKKKRSAWPYIIVGIVVVLLAVCVGGGLAAQSLISGGLSKINSPTTYLSSYDATSTAAAKDTGDNGPYASTKALNLTVTYASVKMTFTSLEQKKKFADDYTTTYSLDPKASFVRLAFKEQQTAKESSYFSYTNAFHLILPDGSLAAAKNAQQYSGPEQSVSRDNWVDFQTSGRVDLNKLKLQLGGSDEAQMTFSLQNNADLSQYNPKTVQLNKQVSYASVNWTLKDATQSLYFNGAQAKSGKVYITVDLVANNPGSSDVYLYNFVRLKSGDSTVAPEYGSDTNNFDTINPNTSNLTGSVTFLIPPSSDGTYILDFLAGDNITEQTTTFQIS